MPFIFALILTICSLSVSAFAVPLPGTTPTGISPVLPSPDASVTLPFTLGDISGAVRQDVFLNTTVDGITGTSFLWTIAVAPSAGSTAINVFSTSSVYSTLPAALDYLVVGTTVAPLSVGKPNGFQWSWGLVGSGFSSGDTAALFLQTNLDGFYREGALGRVLLVSVGGEGMPRYEVGLDGFYIPAPEPSTLALLGSGIGLLMWRFWSWNHCRETSG